MGLFRFFTIITVLQFLRLKSKYDSITCIFIGYSICYYATIYKLCNNISFKIRILFLFSKKFVHQYTVKRHFLAEATPTEMVIDEDEEGQKKLVYFCDL